VFPRAGPDLLDKENLPLSGHEPRMFHVIILVTIPESGSVLFIEVCTSRTSVMFIVFLFLQPTC
jgi:hypothetical protein